LLSVGTVGTAIVTGLRRYDYTPSKRLQFCFLLVTKRVYLHCVELIWNDFMWLIQIVKTGNEKHGRPVHTI